MSLQGRHGRRPKDGAMWPQAKEAGSSQMLEEARDIFPPKASKKADSLIWDFRPRELWENQICFTAVSGKPELTCYCSPRKLIHVEIGFIHSVLNSLCKHCWALDLVLISDDKWPSFLPVLKELIVECLRPRINGNCCNESAIEEWIKQHRKWAYN